MSEIGEVIAQRLLSVKVNGKTYTYRVVFESDEDGRIVADCPALEGCYTEGRTLEEAIEMMQDALKLSIESRIEIGENVPRVIYRRNAPETMLLGDRKFNFTHSFA